MRPTEVGDVIAAMVAVRGDETMSAVSVVVKIHRKIAYFGLKFDWDERN